MNKPIPIQEFEREQKNVSRIKLIPLADIKPDLSTQYLIKGIIPRCALLVLWGPPKSGKSFWIFDACMHIALGWEYRGRRVKQGTVVYLYLEGQQSFGKRKSAFLQHHPGIDEKNTPFYLIAVPIDLVKDEAELIAAIARQSDGPAIVVIDTLNRSLVGSESNDQDMGAYVKAADAIRAKFNCTVAIVHHCGIAKDRPRGHTSLTGACDAQLAAKKDGDLTVVTVELLKDGAAGDVLYSRLEPVEVGIDEDGDAITSCVVVEAESNGAKSRAKLDGKNLIALNLLNDLILSEGVFPPEHERIRRDIRCVTVNAWRDHFYKGAYTERDTQNTRKVGFHRAFKKLHEDLKIVGFWDDWVRPI